MQTGEDKWQGEGWGEGAENSKAIFKYIFRCLNFQMFINLLNSFYNSNIAFTSH